MVETVTIARLGAGGDGVAEGSAGRVFVPLTVPGDQVRIRATAKDKAELVEILSSGPARVAPPCIHFGRCGGCALQHLDSALIATWKRDRIVAALTAIGIVDPPVAATIAIPPATRRRATLAAKRNRAATVLGFAERASHRLVDLAECRILRPELTALIAPLRALMARVLNDGETADIAMTLAENGIELVIVRERGLTLEDREILAAFAETHDLARIAWRPKLSQPAEPVAERRAPLVAFGTYRVALPPGGFLQPSAEGEAHLTRLVMDALDGAAAPILDLFCGLGTFALPASALGLVTACDGDNAAIGALLGCVRMSGLTPRVTATRRDLFREPLTPAELNGFAAAIIDPPRAGAAAQTRALAQSQIPVIAAVSCNPASFARDAATLIAGGYRLEAVTPVDQFLWSPHVELVAVFRRD